MKVSSISDTLNGNVSKLPRKDNNNRGFFEGKLHKNKTFLLLEHT